MQCHGARRWKGLHWGRAYIRQPGHPAHPSHASGSPGILKIPEEKKVKPRDIILCNAWLTQLEGITLGEAGSGSLGILHIILLIFLEGSRSSGRGMQIIFHLILLLIVLILVQRET